MVGQCLVDGHDVGGQHPPEQRMGVGEGAPRRRRCDPHRGSERFRELHREAVRALRVDVRSEDQGGTDRTVEGGEQFDRHRLGRFGRRGDAPLGEVGGVGRGLVLPVVVGHRDVDRAGGGQGRHVDGLADGAGHVLGAGRFGAPLGERSGQARRIDVGQHDFLADGVAHLLPRGDHQRRVRVHRVGEHPHAVAGAGCGVQVHEDRLSARLRVTVRHRHHGALVETEDVLEVLGEILEKQKFVRAGVAEDRGHTVPAQQLEGHFANRGHAEVPLQQDEKRIRRVGTTTYQHTMLERSHRSNRFCRSHYSIHL